MQRLFQRPTQALPVVLALALVFLSGTPTPASLSERLDDPWPNVAPLAEDRRVVVESDAGPTRTPSVLLHVYDVEDDPLSIASFEPPVHGTVHANTDGTFNYTPKPGYLGDDDFIFTLTDGRGGTASATMRVRVVEPSKRTAPTAFERFAEITVDGQAVEFGSSPTYPRAVRWDDDQRTDLLIATTEGVFWLKNVGTRDAPVFAAPEFVLDQNTAGVTMEDVDHDGISDLVTVDHERRVMWYRQIDRAQGLPVFDEPRSAVTNEGSPMLFTEPRGDLGDLDGDGLIDAVMSAYAGPKQVRYGVGEPGDFAFAEPTTLMNTAGASIGMAYNGQARVTDLNFDGLPDLVESYNWGMVRFRLNHGRTGDAQIGQHGDFAIRGKPGEAPLSLHNLTNGPRVDFADFNGDGVNDIVVGGELQSRVWIAYGACPDAVLDRIATTLAVHPSGLGQYLGDPREPGPGADFKADLAALHDYTLHFASPTRKQQVRTRLLELIAEHPHYLRHQVFDHDQNPGVGWIASQFWITAMLIDYYNPTARRELVEAAEIPGGYAKLIEDTGLVYIDNAQSPTGADAIHRWLVTVPRELYPGDCITSGLWMDDRPFLARCHGKNIFAIQPGDHSGSAFGPDGDVILGKRGTIDTFIEVVHHEAVHDLDSWVVQRPRFNRRWGQMLVAAGGPDMRADPETGWLSMERTMAHLRSIGRWDGDPATRQQAWQDYWKTPPGSLWHEYGFMRSNVSFFYAAPQESLATQANQHFNTSEGRLLVAIDRYRRGFPTNLTEVLFFLDVWSLGLDKMKFYEVDAQTNQTISFAKLGRNQAGYIDRVEVEGRVYRFVVNDRGVVKQVLEAPGF